MTKEIDKFISSGHFDTLEKCIRELVMIWSFVSSCGPMGSRNGVMIMTQRTYSEKLGLDYWSRNNFTMK